MSRSFFTALACSCLSVMTVGCGQNTGSSAKSPAPETVTLPTSDGDRVADPDAVARGPDTTIDTPPSQDATDQATPDAEKVLAAAIDQASQEDKRVLVHIGAPG